MLRNMPVEMCWTSFDNHVGLTVDQCLRRTAYWDTKVTYSVHIGSHGIWHIPKALHDTSPIMLGVTVHFSALSHMTTNMTSTRRSKPYSVFRIGAFGLNCCIVAVNKRPFPDYNHFNAWWTFYPLSTVSVTSLANLLKSNRGSFVQR